MPVALHVAADDGAVEDVESGEQRGRTVAFVVVGHRSGAARLHRQTGLGPDIASAVGYVRKVAIGDVTLMCRALLIARTENV